MSFIKKLAELYDNKLENTITFLKSSSIINLTKNTNINMYDLYLSKKEKDKAWLTNKNNTIAQIAEEKFSESVFITVTSNTRHNINDYFIVEDLSFNKDINNNFNDFFRHFFKLRIFKTYLRTDNRFYISVNEFTKNLVLHRHFLQYLNSVDHSFDYVQKFVEHYKRHSCRYNVGRTEVVVSDLVFKRLLSSSLFFKTKLGGVNVLVLKDSDIKSGSFLYVKKIVKNKDNLESDHKILTKYILKYVNKNLYNGEDMSDFAKASSFLHSYFNIRKYNTSRYMFSRNLYDNLVLHDNNNTHIYDMFTLKDLTYFKNSGNIEIIYSFTNEKLNNNDLYLYFVNKFFEKEEDLSLFLKYFDNIDKFYDHNMDRFYTDNDIYNAHVLHYKFFKYFNDIDLSDFDNLIFFEDLDPEIFGVKYFFIGGFCFKFNKSSDIFIQSYKIS